MKTQSRGLSIQRHFTREGANRDAVLREFRWKFVDCVVTSPDGKETFRKDHVEVPEGWSEQATTIFAKLYCRKKGGTLGEGGETSARQVCGRIARAITLAGIRQGHLRVGEDAVAFEGELLYLMLDQRLAFNSPVWFNVGLWEAYGISGKGEQFAYDPSTGKGFKVGNVYERPQASACFLADVPDDLMGIFDSIKMEAALFKMGSGVGANMSAIRGRQEELSSGGTSSGLMSFLKVFDAGAGSLKSGGTTRRSATMRVVDMDHPDILEFITWKSREEDKARALIREGYSADFNGEAYATIGGQNSNNSVMVTDAFLDAVKKGGKWQTIARTTGKPLTEYDAAYLWRAVAEAAWGCADPGVMFRDTMNKWNTVKAWGPIVTTNPCVSGDTFVLMHDGNERRIADLVGQPCAIIGNDGEFYTSLGAYSTGVKPVFDLLTDVQGLRVTLTAEHKVTTTNRGDVEAQQLVVGDRLLVGHLRFCGGVEEPDGRRSVAFVSLTPAGEQAVYDLTESATGHFVANGLVVANCGEYVFQTESACNLACHNVRKYLTDATGAFDHLGFRHACRLALIAQDILVDHASYPSAQIAENSHKLRPLGQGYANLGAMFMALGLPYDSDAARAWCSAITAMMHGTCYATSVEMARALGPFEAYEANRVSMDEVIGLHRRAWGDLHKDVLKYVPQSVVDAAENASVCMIQGTAPGVGYRNAQVTLLMPAGTVGLVMGASTTGIEPEYALVKDKALAGGGTMRYVNHDVTAGLRACGFDKEQVVSLMHYLLGTRELPFDRRVLMLSDAAMELAIGAAATATSFDEVFSAKAIGQQAYDASTGKMGNGRGRAVMLLNGWAPEAIDAHEKTVFGHGTFEGHPLMTPEKLAVFDCASTNGDGERYIQTDAHLTMMAAAQPFLSGGISKTLNCQEDTTVEEVQALYVRAHKLGLKAVALYRNNSKGSQPLSSGTAKSAKTSPAPADEPDHDEADRDVEDEEEDDDMTRREGESIEAWDGRTHTFECATCGRRVGWGEGGSDDNDCGACWYKKHPEEVNIQARRKPKTNREAARVARVVSLDGPPPAPLRHKLPSIRAGKTYKLEVDGQSLYLTTGVYPDGRLGEVFLTIQKQGGQLAGFVAALAKSMSLGLQCGIPLEAYVKLYAHMRFEPAGPVQGHPHVKMCSSLADLVVRVLAADCLGDHALSNVKPEDTFEKGEVITMDFEGLRKDPSDEARLDDDLRKYNRGSRRERRPWCEVGPDDLSEECDGCQMPRCERTGPTNDPGGHCPKAPKEDPPSHLAPIRMPAETKSCRACGNTMRRMGACFTCQTCGLQDGCG